MLPPKAKGKKIAFEICSEKERNEIVHCPAKKKVRVQSVQCCCSKKKYNEMH